METKENVTPQQVIENVHKAAEILKQQGEAGLKILSDPVSEFNTGDRLYFHHRRGEKPCSFKSPFP